MSKIHSLRNSGISVCIFGRKCIYTRTRFDSPIMGHDDVFSACILFTGWPFIHDNREDMSEADRRSLVINVDCQFYYVSGVDCHSNSDICSNRSEPIWVSY